MLDVWIRSLELRHQILVCSVRAFGVIFLFERDHPVISFEVHEYQARFMTIEPLESKVKNFSTHLLTMFINHFRLSDILVFINFNFIFRSLFSLGFFLWLCFRSEHFFYDFFVVFVPELYFFQSLIYVL